MDLIIGEKLFLIQYLNELFPVGCCCIRLASKLLIKTQICMRTTTDREEEMLCSVSFGCPLVEGNVITTST